MMADNVSENVLYALFVSIVFRLSQFVVFILSAIKLISISVIFLFVIVFTLFCSCLSVPAHTIIGRWSDMYSHKIPDCMVGFSLVDIYKLSINRVPTGSGKQGKQGKK